jgi:methylenetetrahydrofolate--tRNA-(uracil-5-)-methyltransferase
LTEPSSFRPSTPAIVVIGAGLAGAEAAWQAAQRGVRVVLYEMRPRRTTPAHESGEMAELVCSNSLGSSLPDRALGLLKNELRRMGSLNIACADATAVPAGDALAVDRAAFSRAVTAAIEGHPNIEVRREEVVSLAPGPSPWDGEGCLSQGAERSSTEQAPLVVATGPLTSQPLAEAIRALAGQEHLYFFDAMAPIVMAESIDMSIAWRGNRWGRGAPVAVQPYGGQGSAEEENGSSVLRLPSSAGDYINCPLNRDEYTAFVDAVNQAEKISPREFELDPAARRYFEACLPIEVLAARSPDALAFGPMTPMGLRDPRTGRRPFAAVQLRQDNAAGTLLNMVGFQTHLKWGDQERVLRLIPGLAHADFVRLGQMHRNTYISSPTLLRPTLQWHDRPALFFAGQITGTEGYVGSTMSGLLAGMNAARVALSRPPLILPPTTMAGALLAYITRADPKTFQPMKANFGLMPELESPVKDKRLRHAAYAARALRDLDAILSFEMA